MRVSFAAHFALSALALSAAFPGVARAGDEANPPVASSHADTTITAPPGSSGLTVVSPYPGGGQVVAAGCSEVTVNGAPTWVTRSGAPCPQYAPYQPYVPDTAPQPRYERVRWPRDDERSGALIASSIAFGLGGAVAGIAYVIAYESDDSSCSPGYVGAGSGQVPAWSAGCRHPSSATPLVLYGAVVGLAPSVPRWTVGDVKGGLLFAGLRVASVTAAALVPWGDGDGKWTGAFLFGFAAPIALGIVDLATTPHREELEPTAKGARVTSVAPVALADRGGAHGALLAVGGRF